MAKATDRKASELSNSWWPIIVGIVLVILLVYLRLRGIIPGPAEIIQALEGWYREYGYWIIFLSAVIEGLFVVNLYFPGSTSILLGVAFARRADLSVPLFVSLAIIGFAISYSLNYLIGRHGIYRLLTQFGYQGAIQEIRHSLEEKGGRMMLTAFFHPNLAALVTTGAGVIGMPFPQFFFYMIISLVLWDSIWGLTVYFLGDQILTALSGWLGLPITLLWMYLVYMLIPRSKKRSVV